MESIALAYLIVSLQVGIAMRSYSGRTSHGFFAFFLFVLFGILLALFLRSRAEVNSKVKQKTTKEAREAIESAYPGMRATPLARGAWLLTERATGRTVSEINSTTDTVHGTFS